MALLYGATANKAHPRPHDVRTHDAEHCGVASYLSPLQTRLPEHQNAERAASGWLVTGYQIAKAKDVSCSWAHMFAAAACVVVLVIGDCVGTTRCTFVFCHWLCSSTEAADCVTAGCGMLRQRAES
jgi:hypothetical protein